MSVVSFVIGVPARKICHVVLLSVQDLNCDECYVHFSHTRRSFRQYLVRDINHAPQLSLHVSLYGSFHSSTAPENAASSPGSVLYEFSVSFLTSVCGDQVVLIVSGWNKSSQFSSGHL